MATPKTMSTPSKNPSDKTNSRKHHQSTEPSMSTRSASDFRTRFEAYNRLQSAAVAFGEKLPIPEIVAVGGQSDGKSSLLEALLGFRFNIREVEMGTRRPLILQMVHEPGALEPRCRFQGSILHLGSKVKDIRTSEEDSEEYGSPIVLSSAIADIIKSRTEALLKRTHSAVSSKPIVMRAEYAHCPNLTIIDTPGFVLKAKKGEPENTPDEILSMVKTLASPPHRILLFLQQSSVEWCSSLWLDAVREIDPTFRRTVIVVSKFDNRLKEFSDRWEVDRYLSASGYLGENTRPFFVALPKDKSTVSNEEFRRQISQVDLEVLRHLREGVKGGFDEEKFRSYIGFACLRDYLESELQKQYKGAAPATLALLEQRCNEVTAELARMESKIQATSDVAHLRRSAMLHAASICNHVGALIDGAADPAPEQWAFICMVELLLKGLCTNFVVLHIPSNAPKCQGRRWQIYYLPMRAVVGGRGVTEAAAEIARAAAQSWLAPLLDTACDRLAFVLGNLFDLAVERNHHRDSGYGRKNGEMDGYVGFHAALRHSYCRFIKDLAKQCKQLVRHHLDSVTSPYSQVCYENNFLGTCGSDANSVYRFNQASAASFCLELSDGGATLFDDTTKDQENIPPEKNAQQTTPGKVAEAREALQESQMTVPETPSPDQPSDGNYVGVKKELGNCIEHFARIREVLVERSVTSTLNSGFLTPGNRDRLVVALGLELFGVNDEKFMDMFVAPGAIDILQNEQQSLQKRQKVLHSCLNEFKTVARTL
ncbi:dynamin related protein 5A [Actinidia rufa]|uniref:Dynamin related protein 5A n=1 Tax=Actinidia rufa TaxID=165716 RepID=A0A7J0G9P3_9ERIC|nr:dynamin related protein 5A [Actinidia rufa]